MKWSILGRFPDFFGAAQSMTYDRRDAEVRGNVQIYQMLRLKTILHVRFLYRDRIIESIDLHSFPDNFTPIALRDDRGINSE